MSGIVIADALAKVAVPVLDGFTVTVMDRLPTLPPESVTAAVMVCVPWLSARVQLPPVPSWPSRLDVHTRRVVSEPSSTSVAVPVQLMLEPAVKLVPLLGVVRLTVGGLLVAAPCTVTVTDRVAVRPPESV